MKKVWSGVCVVGGEEVGTYDVEYDPSSFRKPESYHFLCPDCGDKWGSLLTEQVGVKEYHRAVCSPCECCGGGVIFLHMEGGLGDFKFKPSQSILKRDFMILSGCLLEGKKVHENVRFMLL